MFNFTISTISINYQATKILFLSNQKHTTLPNNSKQQRGRKNRTCLPRTMKRRPAGSWHQQKMRRSEVGRGWNRKIQEENVEFLMRPIFQCQSQPKTSLGIPLNKAVFTMCMYIYIYSRSYKMSYSSSNYIICNSTNGWKTIWLLLIDQNLLG